MSYNNHKNVKGVKGLLRVQTSALNTVKAFYTNPFRHHVKCVKCVACVRARERNSTILININKDIKLSHARYKYTLNILNTLHKPYTAGLSNVKGLNCTLNTLNILKNMV